MEYKITLLPERNGIPYGAPPTMFIADKSGPPKFIEWNNRLFQFYAVLSGGVHKYVEEIVPFKLVG